MRILASALLLSVATVLPAQGTVRGRVFDTYTKAPLADVTVTVGSATATSATDGSFSVACTEKAPVSARRLGYTRMWQR